MTLIFDSFPSHAAATAFAVAVRQVEPELTVTICDSVEESDRINLFPFRLTPPIVHVERPYDGYDSTIRDAREIGIADETPTGAEREAALELIVVGFDGECRGT